MGFTDKQQNREYWRKRVIDKIKSVTGQLYTDFQNIISDMEHVNLDCKRTREIMSDIQIKFAMLKVEITNAKEKEHDDNKAPVNA